MQRVESIRAAQSLLKQDRSRALAALNEIFRAGAPPNPVPNARYAGELIALDVAPGLTQCAEFISERWMPWKGKRFDSAYARGDNIFTRDSYALAHIFWPLYRAYQADTPETYRAFTFQTRLAPGLMDPDRQVLKLDYGLKDNPGFSVRRVLDEIVQIAGGCFLGKAHLKWWWGSWQTVAFFSLSPIGGKI